MIVAMDSANRKASGRGLGMMSCLFVLSLVGCSQLHSSKSTMPPPMLGTMRPGVDDPYLAHHNSNARSNHNHEAAASQEMLVSAPPASESRPASTSVLPDLNVPEVPEGQIVGLGPPVSLPTPTNPAPKPTLLASNESTSMNGATGTVTRSTLAPPPLEAPRAVAEPRPQGPTLEAVVNNARRKLDQMKTYQVALHRQERVNGVLLPEEDVILSVRRSPKAVRLEWPTGQSKGREVIYSASENGGLMHVNMANAIVPMPRLSLPPDSPLVMKNSRHPITEAGFDNIVANLEGGLQVKSGPNRLVLAGVETPREVGKPCHKLTRVGPKGEQWVVYIDQQTGLPAVVQESSPSGELMERYVFRDVKPDLAELNVAAAFDVNQRWGSGGFLSRLARAGAADAGNAANTTQR